MDPAPGRQPVRRRAVLRYGVSAALLPLGGPRLGHRRDAGPEADTPTRPAVRVAERRFPAALTNGEHVVATPDVLEAVGAVVGQQLRVRRDAATLAVYTVTATAAAARPTLWLTEAGRARLDDRTDGPVTVRTPVPVAEGVATARRTGEYVTTLVDGGDRLAVVAPHGGHVEAHTAEQADHVASLVDGATAWTGRGYRPDGGAYDRWHVTSTDLHPASYPALARIADRGFTHAVSFHGYRGEGVRVGGAAPRTVRQAVAAAVEARLPESVPVDLTTDGPYAGRDPENVVNWLTEHGTGGVQLEQSYAVRSNHGTAVAEAVAAAVDSFD
jgi:phage replication-related protein YjqB (UPF0714/DUF867 family)